RCFPLLQLPKVFQGKHDFLVTATKLYILRQMHVWRRGLRPDLLREVRRFPDLIFRPQNHQNLWRPGSATTRWRELERSPRPPSTVGAMEGNILVAVWALCGEEGMWKV